MNISHFHEVNGFHLESLDFLEQELKIRDVDVLHLDGASVTDKASLVARVAVDLGAAEGLQPVNWDGFADTFWQVLSARTADRVALVWTHAELMIEQSFNDFLVAITILADTARAVNTTRHGFSHPIQFQVFLMGEGTIFPRLEDWREERNSGDAIPKANQAQ